MEVKAWQKLRKRASVSTKTPDLHDACQHSNQSAQRVLFHGAETSSTNRLVSIHEGVWKIPAIVPGRCLKLLLGGRPSETGRAGPASASIHLAHELLASTQLLLILHVLQLRPNFDQLSRDFHLHVTNPLVR